MLLYCFWHSSQAIPFFAVYTTKLTIPLDDIDVGDPYDVVLSNNQASVWVVDRINDRILEIEESTGDLPRKLGKQGSE